MSARPFVRDSLAVAASQYLARAAMIARGLVAAAALGPQGYGGWNALNLILDYGSYASIGALQGLDLKLPPAVLGGEAAQARRLMAGAWLVVIAGGALFGLGLAVYLVSGGEAFSFWPGHRLPLLMLAAALLQLGFQYLTSSLRAYGRFQAVSAGNSIQAVVGGGLGLALVWSLGAWGLVLGWLAGTFFALEWMRRSIPEAPIAPSSPAVGGSLARAGLPIFGYFAATLLLRSVDRLALLRWSGEEALGLYGLGLMASGMALYLPEAAAFVLFPRMAAAFHGSRDLDRTRVEALRAQRALTVLVPPLIALGMVWAGPLVAWLLPAYREGLPALRFLAIGAMTLSAATVPGYFLLAAGRYGRLLGIAVGAAAVNGALVSLAAARGGAPGAVAAAASSGHALFATLVLAAAAREWFVSLIERARLMAASLLPAAWAGLVTLLACRVGADDSWTAAVIRSAAVATAYVPVAAWLGREAGLMSVARDWLAGRVTRQRS